MCILFLQRTQIGIPAPSAPSLSPGSHTMEEQQLKLPSASTYRLRPRCTLPSNELKTYIQKEFSMHCFSSSDFYFAVSPGPQWVGKSEPDSNRATEHLCGKSKSITSETAWGWDSELPYTMKSSSKTLFLNYLIHFQARERRDP